MTTEREALLRVLNLADAFTTAVDREYDDIGGSRPSLEILRELGPAVEEAFAALRGKDKEPIAPASETPFPRTFEYLLNGMEAAAQESNPDEHGYGEKRERVFEYVKDLFSDYLRRHNDACDAEDRLRALAQAKEAAEQRARHWEDMYVCAQNANSYRQSALGE